MCLCERSAIAIACSLGPIISPKPSHQIAQRRRPPVGRRGETLGADLSVYLAVRLSAHLSLGGWGVGGKPQAVNDRQHDILSCLRAVSDRLAEMSLKSQIARSSFAQAPDAF